MSSRLLSAASALALMAGPALADSFNRIATFPVIANMAEGEDNAAATDMLRANGVQAQARALGAGAAVNLQYRYDVAPGNLWNARLHIGNVTWVGDLNL